MSQEIPRPFIKWAGGKHQLLPSILAALPTDIPKYVEPFLGGGAVFFELARLGRLQGQVLLADQSEDLINAWLQVQARPLQLADVVDSWGTDEGTYYQVRDASLALELERAAQFIYLNRTCFNGLYRVNSKGRFNTPYGGTGRVIYPIDRDNLMACSRALQGVELRACDFSETLRAAEGAVVYCDPPYWPATDTSFTSYSKEGFGPSEHRRLLSDLLRVERSGGSFLLSNADLPETRELYDGLKFRSLLARRNVSAGASARVQVSELLVSSGE